MKSAIDRIKLIFLGVFIVACGAVWYYHATYVWPKERCEGHGNWWDEKDRVCAVPVPIWTFTHRVPGEVAPAHRPAAKPATTAQNAPQPAAKAAKH